MTANERAIKLANDFMAGFRANLRCPDVAPSEYQGVMVHRIEEAIVAAIKEEREACHEIADKYWSECGRSGKPPAYMNAIEELDLRIRARPTK
jgi:hypothetical protein